jgi:transcription antitermination factor NusG
MSYWAVARLEPRREQLALRCLGLAVADQIIDDLRKRERNGLIELPQRPELKPGDRVRILQGPFAGHLGLYAGAGMRAHERVLVLLARLGRQQRVELARDAIEVVHCD